MMLRCSANLSICYFLDDVYIPFTTLLSHVSPSISGSFFWLVLLTTTYLYSIFGR